MLSRRSNAASVIRRNEEEMKGYLLLRNALYFSLIC
jgi:hypothetical protein